MSKPLLLLVFLNSPTFQSSLDLFLKSLLGRMIINFSSEILWKIFLFNEVVGIIMGIFVIFSISQIFHQRRGSISDMKRNGHVLQFPDIFLDPLKRCVEG